MNKKVPLLIMHFRRANTIYSYQVLWWLNAVCCPLVVEWERKWRVACTKGRCTLPEEEKLYTRLSFLVLFTFQNDPSVKQQTNPSWVDYTVARLCWMRNIYSTIRVYALDYVPWLRGGKRRGTVLCIAWLSWNENEASRLSTSLLLGSLVERERERERERTKFPFQRLQLKSYSNSINRRRHMIPVVGESQKKGGG